MRSYASEEMKELGASDIPSLIFINQFDPVTPPENAMIFQSDMTNVHTVVIDGGGHRVGDIECMRAIMDAFMTAADAELDAGCLRLYGGLSECANPYAICRFAGSVSRPPRIDE